MSAPVKLSRERWEMLVASQEWPILGMYADGTRFLNVLAPIETPSCIFLPATYASGGPERVSRVQRLSPPPCA